MAFLCPKRDVTRGGGLGLNFRRCAICQFASFFFHPLTGDVVIHDLNSHGETEKILKLNLNIWREGHYTPDGNLELRFTDADRIDKIECEERFKNCFPNFISFLNWAFKQKSYKSGSLDLRGKSYSLKEAQEYLKTL